MVLCMLMTFSKARELVKVALCSQYYKTLKIRFPSFDKLMMVIQLNRLRATPLGVVKNGVSNTILQL